MRLARRRGYSSAKSLFTFVDSQIAGRGSLHGYRWMHQPCKAKGLKVKREHVRLMLNTIDPVGLQLRSKRRLNRREYYSGGPNFCWPMESYDKLKKYGLCINGCIDGYSRKLVWLKVGRTSSNPRVIARYFVEAIKEHQGHPQCIRGDLGTENGLVAAMQTFLSAENENVSKPFIYGKSTMNTRIESFWCILRRKCCQIWIDELKDLLNNGDFTIDILDINLIQFCFMKLLQDELNHTAHIWNTHKIRCSRKDSHYGRPINMYLFPELFNVQDYSRPVDEQLLEHFQTEYDEEETYPCEEEKFELGCIYMDENMLNPPANIYEA